MLQNKINLIFCKVTLEISSKPKILTYVNSAATHHNMLLDPAILCNACLKEYLHYWAKSSIFVNKYATQFLNSVGCVPVDRESKDHIGLYQATFDVLELKESIAVFPEGTSHTLSRISKLRDGASFVRFTKTHLKQISLTLLYL